MGQSSPLRSSSHGAGSTERVGRSKRKKLPPTPPLLPLQPLLLPPRSRLLSLSLPPCSPQSAGFLGCFEVEAMKKSNKVVLAQPAATAPRVLPRAPRPVRGAVAAGGGGESHRARLRHKSLLQDYKELLKETAAKKNRLHMEKLKKQRLLAEVKFLRARYKSMSENPSQTVVYKVKNPAMGRPASPTTAWVDRQRPVQHVGSSSRAPVAQQQWQHPAPRPRATPVVIDLNEACEPSSEETEEFHGYQQSVAAGPSDAKTAAAFWGVQNPAVRAGKRKISWQDQLALRV